jgi:hypothetical protein
VFGRRWPGTPPHVGGLMAALSEDLGDSTETGRCNSSAHNVALAVWFLRQGS